MSLNTGKLGLRIHLSRYIREHTRDGEELVDLCLDILRGKVRGKADTSVAQDLRLRLAAMEWLADRGFGKAPIEINVDTDSGVRAALAEYTLEELARMAQVMDGPVIEAFSLNTKETVLNELCEPTP